MGRGEAHGHLRAAALIAFIRTHTAHFDDDLALRVTLEDGADSGVGQFNGLISFVVAVGAGS